MNYGEQEETKKGLFADDTRHILITEFFSISFVSICCSIPPTNNNVLAEGCWLLVAGWG